VNNKQLLAYTAGYIDGDGCFYLNRRLIKNNIIGYVYAIQVTSTKKPVLNILMSKFGGSIHEIPAKGNSRQLYHWDIKSKLATQLALKIYPYLTDKLIQCKLFLRFSELSHPRCFGKHHNKREKIIYDVKINKHIENFIKKDDVQDLKKLRKTIKPSRIDYAYLAGLIDAEGCLSIRKRIYIKKITELTRLPDKKQVTVYTIIGSIPNTRKPILKWLIERFGGCLVYRPKKNKNSNAYCVWAVSNKTLSEILLKIKTFLVSKKDVCNKLIEFQKTVLPNGRNYYSEEFQAFAKKREIEREEIIEEVHRLNHKGTIPFDALKFKTKNLSINRNKDGQ
jgi:intein/homing endonuclease